MMQYALLMDAPASIAILEGPEHMFRFANDSYNELVGKDRKLIGRTVREAFPELADQGYYDLLDSVYKTQEPYIILETPVRLLNKKTGELEDIYVNLTYKPIIDASETSIGIFVHATDVTQYVLDRREVEISKKRYESLLTTIDEGFCVIEVLFDAKKKPYDYRFIETNAIFDQQTGLSNAPGRTIRELAPTIETHWFEIYGKVAKSGKSVRFSEGSDALGKWYDVYASKVVGSEDGENQVAVLFKDISESKRAQQELIDQQRLTETITNNVTVGLCMVDPEGRLTYMNPAACKITGFTPSESLGKSLHDLVHHTKQDGSPFPESECQLMQTYLNGDSYKEQETVFYKKSNRPFPVRISSTPIKDDGDISGSIVEFRDISDERTAAKKIQAATKRRDQLERTTNSLQLQREHLLKLNQAKDEFISLASHQLRTPATGVKQYLGILSQGYMGDIPEEQLAMINKAYDANERELTIVEDLLRVAQVDAGKVSISLGEVNLEQLITDILDGFGEKSSDKHISLSLEQSVSEATIQADEKLLRMVLENLIDNAIKYTPDGGSVTISTKHVKAHVIIDVKDTGIGIAEEDRAKLFQKFSRVSNKDSTDVAGSGLGLYWVKRVLDLHSGHVTILRNKPRGTVFRVSIPVPKK